MTMIKAFEWLFYACANLLPQLALVTITCRDFLRFSLKKTIVLSLGVLLWFWGFLIASEVNLVSYMALNFILNGSYVAFGILLTKDKPWQFLFSLTLVLNYGSVCGILSGGIFNAIGRPELMYCWQDSLLTIAIATIFWIPYYWLLIRKIRPLFMQDDPNEIWHILWLIPGLFCIIHYFLIWTYGGFFCTSIVNVLFLVFINIGSTLVSYMVAKMVDERTRLLLLESENQLLTMQAAQYESLKIRIAETRRARHDLQQHLRLIQSYLDNNNTTALQDYVKAYGQSLPKDIDLHFCDNPVADTVIKYYAQLSEAQGISFKAKVQLPDQLNIPDPDLCVLIGNLLENALESCKKHPQESPYINMGCRLMGTRMLTIIVDNCSSEKPKTSHGKLLSSKHTAMGIGTESIKAVAKRYNGETRFEWENKIFSASVVLTLPE